MDQKRHIFAIYIDVSERRREYERDPSVKRRRNERQSYSDMQMDGIHLDNDPDEACRYVTTHTLSDTTSDTLSLDPVS